MKRGVPLSLKGDWGETAAHVAAGKGNLATLELIYANEPDW